MYKGYRQQKLEGSDVVWRFFSGEQGEQEAHAAFRFALPESEPKRIALRNELESFADACWQQGRASAHDEHKLDSEMIEAYKKQNGERWTQIKLLQQRIAIVEQTMTRAWLEARDITPEELRDALKAE